MEEHSHGFHDDFTKIHETSLSRDYIRERRPLPVFSEGTHEGRLHWRTARSLITAIIEAPPPSMLPRVIRMVGRSLAVVVSLMFLF